METQAHANTPTPGTLSSSYLLAGLKPLNPTLNDLFSVAYSNRGTTRSSFTFQAFASTTGHSGARAEFTFLSGSEL